jgi:hypothetical protein
MSLRHDDDLADMKQAQILERRYLAALSRNPDCRDPAHPGCGRCEDRDGNPIETEQEEAA